MTDHPSKGCGCLKEEKSRRKDLELGKLGKSLLLTGIHLDLEKAESTGGRFVRKTAPLWERLHQKGRPLFLSGKRRYH